MKNLSVKKANRETAVSKAAKNLVTGERQEKQSPDEQKIKKERAKKNKKKVTIYLYEDDAKICDQISSSFKNVTDGKIVLALVNHMLKNNDQKQLGKIVKEFVLKELL